MTPEHREALHAPSEWDVVLSPELGPLFVLEAAIITVQRFFSIQLDPSSSLPGGANHRPTRALLHAMRTLRNRIRDHRAMEQAFASGSQSAERDFNNLRGLPKAGADDPAF
jgi:hypothetical protein